MKMKSSTAAVLLFSFFLAFFHFPASTYPAAAAAAAADSCSESRFIQCLYKQSPNATAISKLVYTPRNSSFSTVLQLSMQNLRFNTPSTPKPRVIVTPTQEAEIRAVVRCSRRHGLQIRTRSNGHDFEGLSYVGGEPFVMVDLINYRSVTIDTGNASAWIRAGATNGGLYYSIAQKTRTLGFTSGICPTVGLGGYISGGGYGLMLRRYGIAADNLLDARIMDARGRIYDRKGMGEDLFWAIRGGGGNTFALVLEWKVRLVPVPRNVTVLRVERTLEQGATRLLHKWQYFAPSTDRDLAMRALMRRVNSTSRPGKATIRVTFDALFLGGVDRLLRLMQKEFPELGLAREDCVAMSWVESTAFIAGLSGEPLEVLLERQQRMPPRYKSKSDYVQEPIPVTGFEGLWKLLLEDEGRSADIVFTPYGGRMNEISESSTPFPHRAGVLYMVLYQANWEEEEQAQSQKYFDWIRKVYRYMEKYVSKSPRRAYINYRDLDLGVNGKDGRTSYEQARKWGYRYVKDNFDRLIRVKTMVDPTNFFRHEQSIPPFTSFLDGKETGSIASQ